MRFYLLNTYTYYIIQVQVHIILKLYNIHDAAHADRLQLQFIIILRARIPTFMV